MTLIKTNTGYVMLYNKQAKHFENKDKLVNNNPSMRFAIEEALDEMNIKHHDVAKFGVLGYFLYTETTQEKVWN